MEEEDGLERRLERRSELDSSSVETESQWTGWKKEVGELLAWQTLPGYGGSGYLLAHHLQRTMFVLLRSRQDIERTSLVVRLFAWCETGQELLDNVQRSARESASSTG